MSVPTKLPAYGQTVMRNRRIGFHPLKVKLIYGDDWREASEHARKAKQLKKLPPYTRKWVTAVDWPVTAIAPREYQAGVYDLRLFAGCQVAVIDQVRGADEYEFIDGVYTNFGKLYSLLGELAAIASWVEVFWRPEQRVISIDSLAFLFKICCERRPAAWPPWWSDALAADYNSRQISWFNDNATYNGIDLREPCRIRQVHDAA